MNTHHSSCWGEAKAPQSRQPSHHGTNRTNRAITGLIELTHEQSVYQLFINSLLRTISLDHYIHSSYTKVSLFAYGLAPYTRLKESHKLKQNAPTRHKLCTLSEQYFCAGTIDLCASLQDVQLVSYDPVA
jgi:hypothetical protein